MTENIQHQLKFLAYSPYQESNVKHKIAGSLIEKAFDSGKLLIGSLMDVLPPAYMAKNKFDYFGKIFESKVKSAFSVNQDIDRRSKHCK